MTQIVKQDKITYTQDQVQLIKNQIAPQAKDEELKLFLYQCQRTGLDALSRQIYCIFRKTKNPDGTWGQKMTIQTSIDGFRVIAERSGDYAGQGEPIFIDLDGKLLCAKVPVYRFKNGTRYRAAVGVAYWDEYVQLNDEYINGKPTGKKIASSMWAKMPHVMLSKVAEALALRKAYPQDLSGLYTTEEMGVADMTEEVFDIKPKTEIPKPPPEKPFTEPDFSDVPGASDLQVLRDLLFNAQLSEEKKTEALALIEKCNTFLKYDKIKQRLEALQPQTV